MQLSVYARPGHVVNARPGAVTQRGQILQRVNRAAPQVDPAVLAKPQHPEVRIPAAIPPALPTPHKCDEDSPLGLYLKRLCRKQRKDPPVWAADHATARALDIKYVDVERVDGEWQPKASASKGKKTD